MKEKDPGYVMSDLDSRSFGPVPANRIIGKVVGVSRDYDRDGIQ